MPQHARHHHGRDQRTFQHEGHGVQEIRASVMHQAPLNVRSILGAFRGGSSWPVLVEADGHRCVMKWSGGAEGPSAIAADYIALRLARTIGIAVPTPRLLQLTDTVIDSKQDPELNDLVRRSLGTNLGIDEVSTFQPYEPQHREAVNASLRSTVYAFDLLLLNMDRIADNPNMVMTPNGLMCWDFAAAMELRMLFNGRSIEERQVYPLLRQHPFFEPGPPPPVAWLSIDESVIREILADLPEEWLPTAFDPSSFLSRLVELFSTARATIERRHAGIMSVVVETDAARTARTNANRRAFEDTVRRLSIKPRPSDGS